VGHSWTTFSEIKLSSVLNKEDTGPFGTILCIKILGLKIGI
jgi:hypothetical protein